MPSASSNRRKPVSRAPQPSEHSIQAAWFDWWRLWAPAHGLSPLSAFAIPNGGGRSKAQAGLLKAEGVTAGVFDVFVALPSALWHGLFLEFKRPGEPMRPEQIQFRETSHRNGYSTAMVQSTEEAIEIVTVYLRLAEKRPRFLDFAPRAQ